MAVARGVEVDADVGIPAKKRKTELRLYDKIPVWICEYHQEVLPYIYRAIASRHLPFSGITMLHFDSHPDLMAPLEMKAENVYNKELLFDIVSIADWILPSVYVGHIKKVIWIKPPWSEQICDKTFSFAVGRHKVEGTIRVSSWEKYFCEDSLYAPQDELENCQELTVVVRTMPVNTSQSRLPSGMEVLQCSTEEKQLSYNRSSSEQHSGINTRLKTGREQEGKLKYLHKETVDVDGVLQYQECLGNATRCPDVLKERSAKDNSASNSCKNRGKNSHKTDETSENELFINEVLTHVQEPYILDIDMDFFSTLNPFEMMFSKDEFEELKRFYEFPRVDSCEERNMTDASRSHKENIQRLERTLKFLEESELCPSDEKIDQKFVNFVKKWRDGRSEPIDYDMLHSAGMTTNLPVHITDEQDIIKMMKNLELFLFSVPKPTIITLARSSDDDYTPPSSVDFIQSCLLTCLKNCYSENIEVSHKYIDEQRSTFCCQKNGHCSCFKVSPS